ncbi:MAG TPA: hypothetical protein VKF36_19130, partial [Syntrophorhabdales bacterium]|nr:hypothetical protein [Syntrophorhabdales bacterium]
GANASEIYWGPLQALLYRDAFKEATTKTVSDGIKKMVEQKVKLRLLPKHALNRLPEGDCDRVRAVLAVADPNPNRRECRNRLTQVKTDLTNEGHDVEVVAIAEDFSIKDYK